MPKAARVGKHATSPSSFPDFPSPLTSWSYAARLITPTVHRLRKHSWLMRRGSLLDPAASWLGLSTHVRRHAARDIRATKGQLLLQLLKLFWKTVWWLMLANWFISSADKHPFFSFFLETYATKASRKASGNGSCLWRREARGEKQRTWDLQPSWVLYSTASTVQHCSYFYLLISKDYCCDCCCSGPACVVLRYF